MNLLQQVDAEITATKGATPAPDVISRAEQAVVALAAHGLTNTAIGRRLGRSTNTIKSRLARLTVRLGARNRAHLVAVCISRGLIPPLRKDTPT